MTTKIYGVGMEEVEKLRQFYFLLMKKKFLKPVDKMYRIDFVQIRNENMMNPKIVRLSVVDSNIHLDDGKTIINKSSILKINRDIINEVTLKIVSQLLGPSLTFVFNDNTKKKEFLDAVGEVNPYASDDSSGKNDTPPSSEENSSEEEALPPSLEAPK